MSELLDNIEDTEMARMLVLWLTRIGQDDDYSEYTRDKAADMLYLAEQLRKSISDDQPELDPPPPRGSDGHNPANRPAYGTGE